MTKAEFNWDAIPVKVGVTADPVAGSAPPSVTVPSGKRWRLQSCQASITTDATVANRSMWVWIALDGTNYVYVSNSGLVITASQTKLQSFIRNSLITASGTQYGLHIPDVELPAGAKFGIALNNLQAGDDVTAMTYYYKEAPA
jgi:hypothetical protein